MKEFILIIAHDEKKLKLYQANSDWRQSAILPSFSEGYVCFSAKKDFTFEELLDLFLRGNTNEEIGAISLIAEEFPRHLYERIHDHIDLFSPKKLHFLINDVIPQYLPLILPEKEWSVYEFGKEFSDDVWVKIWNEIRGYLQKLK